MENGQDLFQTNFSMRKEAEFKGFCHWTMYVNIFTELIQNYIHKGIIIGIKTMSFTPFHPRVFLVFPSHFEAHCE